MLIKKPLDIKISEITNRDDYINRRHFLQQAGFVGAAITVGGLSLLTSPSIHASTSPNLPKGKHGTSESLTAKESVLDYCNFYEFGTGKKDPKKYAQEFKIKPWSIVVDGECDKPGRVTLEDFLAPHTLQERIYRLRCVEAWSMVIPWVGFSLGDALKRFQPNSRAKYIAIYTLLDPKQMPGQKRNVLSWPYREGLRIDEAMNPLATLAIGMYGDTLPNQNGAPVRLVLPWKYGFKSIKSIVRIEFTEKQPFTSWNDQAPREYGFYSNVNPEVDHPRWSQKRERRIGEWSKRQTLPFNGYEEQVAHLYRSMDLSKSF